MILWIYDNVLPMRIPAFKIVVVVVVVVVVVCVSLNSFKSFHALSLQIL